MLCSSCGAENTAKAAFCKHCGQALVTEQASPGKKTPWLILVVLLAIAVAGVLGGLVLHPRLVPVGGEESTGGKEPPAAVEYSFQTGAGANWDTGLGLVASVAPVASEGEATLAAQRYASEGIDAPFITSEWTYDVSLTQEHPLGDYSPAVTLSVAIPKGTDPRWAIVLEKTEDGWLPAESTTGLPGGEVSSDGKRIVVVSEHLSQFALGRWLYERIFRHLNRLPQAPPPEPTIEVEQTSGDYLGHPVSRVRVSSPYAVSLELRRIGEVGVGGMWYRIDLESRDASLVRGPTSLAPGEKHDVEIAFPSRDEQVTLCLSTRGTLLRAAWDWASRLGVPNTEANRLIGGVEQLLETYEHLPEGGTSFEDVVWEAKELLIGFVWKSIRWERQYLVNLVPVSVDVATYVSARTDSRPDPCVEVSAPAPTEAEATGPPMTRDNPTVTPGGPPSPPARGSTAYVAAGDDLWVVDVTDPASPRAIGRGTTPRGAREVFVVDDLAYVADGYGDLQLFDVSDPSKPTEVGHSPIPKGATGVFVAGDLAYVTDIGGWLHVIDISRPASPLETGRCEVAGGLAVLLSDSHVYVATGHGLSVVSTIDPSNPQVVGEWGRQDSLVWVFDVSVSEGIAYAVAPDRFWVVDVHDPASPTLTGQTGLPFAWEGNVHVDVAGSYAYVATSDEKKQPVLRVVDVSRPTDPIEVASCNLVGQPKDIFVLGSHAYVAVGSAGLGLVDVSDPANPHAVGYWDDLPAFSESVAVFVTSSERQLAP